MPFFLVCTAMVRRQPLQSVKYIERTGEVTEIAVADELAAAGELVGCKVAGVPVSIVRGYPYIPMEDASIQRILRGSERDLFR